MQLHKRLNWILKPMLRCKKSGAEHSQHRFFIGYIFMRRFYGIFRNDGQEVLLPSGFSAL